jgi:hypothetical protein
MLIGMALLLAGVLTGERSNRFYLKLMRCGYGVGGSVSALTGWYLLRINFNPGVAAHRLPALAAAFSVWPDGMGLAFVDLLAQATDAFARDGDRAAIGTFDGDLDLFAIAWVGQFGKLSHDQIPSQKILPTTGNPPCFFRLSR